MPSTAMIKTQVQAVLPGALCAGIVAIAALFLSQHYGASAMLFALLLGMAVNFLGQEGKCVVGIKFTSSTILRWAVALLGLRITFAAIASLGINTALMVAIAVVLTILFATLLARFSNASISFGILTGGAVAICGASAALAISAVLPRDPHHERDTGFTVIGVTALSTIAMVSYPILGSMIGLSPQEMGVFLGATIHDVAQVVGAGYSVSNNAGDTATVVKLLRVAMLLPVILVLSILMRSAASKVETIGARPPLVPWFAIVFGMLVAINSLVVLPQSLLTAANDVSRFALVLSIAAIGMRTSLKELTLLGMKPVLMMIAETLFLAGIIIGVLKFAA